MFKKKTTAPRAGPQLQDPVVEEVLSSHKPAQGFEKMKSGNKKTYPVSFDATGTFLHAGSKKKIDVSQIKEIRVGYMTQEFLTHGEAKNVPEPHAIAIVYHDPKSVRPKILNLVAEGENERQWWSDALERLTAHINDATGEAYGVLKPWLLTLKDGESDISWKSAQTLLESIGMKCSWSQAKQLVKDFDTDGNKRLDFHEFVRLMRALRAHGVVSQLFSKYAPKDAMGAVELQKFFEQEQKQTLTKDEAEALVKKYAAAGCKPGLLDLTAFQVLMGSKDNNAWNPALTKRHQDMTRPLNEYFIDSSHNTYLVGDQLKSASSIEMYVRALRLGCRCVELDLWDGPNDEPIVHHGYTLTSKILFRDILMLLRSQGFHKTPYPIILSLENHLSKKVQDRAAEHIETILGDIVVPNPSGSTMNKLPSPEQMKGKILIKAKAIASSQVEADEEIEEDALQGEDTREKEPPKPKKTEKISERLSKLVFLNAKHFESFDECKEWQPFQMSSFSEPKTFKYIKKGDTGMNDFRGYNSRCLSRIYPKGTRFDSSNYDPILPWLMGCQIVALNYQTSDTFPMWVNFAKFKVNGHAGYNLRPQYTKFTAPSGQEPFSRPEQPARTIKLRVIGARMLPQRSRLDLLDPYVKVAFVDGGAEPSFKAMSKVVSDNALNPDFDLVCETKVRDFENTFLCLSVYDQNPGSDAFVCHWAAPVSALRNGYRCAKLLDANFNTMSRGLCHALLHIEIK